MGGPPNLIMSDEILIKAENVSKKFCRRLRKSLWYGVQDMAAEAIGGSRSHDELRPDEFWAVKDVSFEVRRGECLGLIGHNGAGKTTLLKMLNGLIKPDHGSITMRGRVGALIALGAGFNPILTGRENIYVNGSVLGLTRAEIETRVEEIIDFAGIRQFIDSPVQSYSSGMQVRLGFSVAATMNPDVLILDEVLAVGDVNFRAKCLNRVASLLQQSACIFVSHQEADVRRIASSCALLSHGELRFVGSVDQAFEQYSELLDGNAAEGRVLGGEINIEPLTDPILVDWGHSLSLTVRLLASREVRDVAIRVSIMDAGQTCVAEWNSIDSNRLYSINHGENQIVAELKHVELTSGSYWINVAIFTNKEPYLGLSYRHAKLIVSGPRKLFSNYRIT